MWKHLLFLFILIMMSLYSLAIYRSHHYYDYAQQMAQQNQLNLARERYQWSMRYYAFGIGKAHESAQALWDIAQRYYDQSRIDEALYTLDLLRGGVWITRSLWDPFSQWRIQVDDRIATLRTQVQEQQQEKTKDIAFPTQIVAFTHQPYTSAEIYQQHRKILAHDPRPHSLISILLSLSFIAWLYTIYQLMSKGFDQHAQLQSNTLRYWIHMLVCMLGWITALYWA